MNDLLMAVTLYTRLCHISRPSYVGYITGDALYDEVETPAGRLKRQAEHFLEEAKKLKKCEDATIALFDILEKKPPKKQEESDE